ncbi:MAG: hypothetical protein ACR2H9_06330 [Longimicrobiaceae bacterium]
MALVLGFSPFSLRSILDPSLLFLLLVLLTPPCMGRTFICGWSPPLGCSH